MATLNTAQLLRIERDYGSVTAGRFADIVILDDLEKVHVDKTLIHGEVISDSGKMTVDLLPYQYPEWAKRTIHVPSSLRPEDLQIKVDDSCHEINVRTIVNSWPKEVIINTLAVEHGKIQPDVEKDLLSIAIVERHKNTGNIGKGFVTGFRIKEGAVASSIQHNSHNIVVIGTNYEDMAIAVNSIIQMGGGYSAVKNGKVVGQVELPIAGLLSEEDYRVVSKKLVAFEQVVMEDLKCGIERPLYTLVFFCAPGVPHAGLTDKGLINVDTMDFMDAVVQ